MLQQHRKFIICSHEDDNIHVCPVGDHTHCTDKTPGSWVLNLNKPNDTCLSLPAPLILPYLQERHYRGTSLRRNSYRCTCIINRSCAERLISYPRSIGSNAGGWRVACQPPVIHTARKNRPLLSHHLQRLPLFEGSSQHDYGNVQRTL